MLLCVVGSNINNSIRNHVQSEMLLGNVADNTITLSDDGLTLTVERTWADSAYDELLQIATEAEIQTLINNLTTVDSATYGFSDI